MPPSRRILTSIMADARPLIPTSSIGLARCAEGCGRYLQRECCLLPMCEASLTGPEPSDVGVRRARAFWPTSSGPTPVSDMRTWGRCHRRRDSCRPAASAVVLSAARGLGPAGRRASAAVPGSAGSSAVDALPVLAAGPDELPDRELPRAATVWVPGPRVRHQSAERRAPTARGSSPTRGLEVLRRLGRSGGAGAQLPGPDPQQLGAAPARRAAPGAAAAGRRPAGAHRRQPGGTGLLPHPAGDHQPLRPHRRCGRPRPRRRPRSRPRPAPRSPGA